MKRDIEITEDKMDTFLESGFVKITTPENTLEARVKFFRDKGFDNNRIAALLSIPKADVDGIE